jgi:hypothetical protein
MTGWTDQEAQFLQEQWQRGSGSLTLSVACPHCLHPAAFKDLVIYDTTVDAGGSGDAGDGVGPAHVGRKDLVVGFPDHATVVCECGHSDHSPSAGCGRSGNIKTGA